MRKLSGLMALLTGFAIWAAPASAQYPDRPIRLVVPFAAGGGTDLMSRTVAKVLSDRIGQPVIVENRPGAGGIIGADMVAKSPPDGYTIMAGTPGSMMINPILMPNPPYDPATAFDPITQVSTSSMVIVVSGKSPYKSVPELIAAAKAAPGKINFGSSGQGSISHISGEQFKAMAGIDITHVPYKGAGQGANGLVSGSVQMLAENLPPMMGLIKSGDIRLLAVGGAKRSVLVPDVPTVAEVALPGYEATTWLGVFAPAKTPRAIIDRLNAEITAGMSQPAILEQLKAVGWEPAVGGTPEELRAYLETKRAEFRKLVEVAGIKPE